MGYRQVGKALDFDSSMRRFKSCYPIQFSCSVLSAKKSPNRGNYSVKGVVRLKAELNRSIEYFQSIVIEAFKAKSVSLQEFCDIVKAFSSCICDTGAEVV